MIKAQNSFKHYVNSLKKKDDSTLSKTRRKVNKRAWKGRWYGGIAGNQGGTSGDAGGIGEGVRAWREVGSEYEEEQEENLRDLDAEPEQDTTSDDMPELGAGEPGLEDEVQEQEPEDPNRQGIIRTVRNAHLVFKRQQEDSTFSELWVYNIGEDLQDEVDLRRDILAGTDIPQKQTQTPDGQQHYQMWTAGNAQLIFIQGLPN